MWRESRREKMKMTEAQLRQKVVGVLQDWIGYNEADGSHKKIIDIYNSQTPLPAGYKVKYSDAWCATCASAAAVVAGLADIIPAECSCPRMVELFKKMDSWKENDAYVPSPGDYIFYDWQDSGVGDNIGTPGHVGVVESVSGNTITVIEGNNSDAVKRRNILVNGRYIRGYGVPKYASKADTATIPNATGLLTIGDTVTFTGSKQFLNSYPGAVAKPAKACAAKVTAISTGKQHPYHLVGTGVYGWVDVAYIQGAATSANTETIKVGDVVRFNGDTHYTSSYAGAKGYSCKGGEAKVAAINRNGAYPYCLAHTGKGCTVQGWVNAADVSR